MTCQDCSLYTGSEEKGRHKSIDGIVCGGIHLIKMYIWYKNNNENNVGVGAGLLVVEISCLVVPISFVFYTINEKCQLEVGSIFYCGTGGWSRCVCTHIVYSTVATFWLFSLVMFG